MLIVYSCSDEVFVTTPSFEESFLKEYFEKGCGRDLDDYDREEYPNGIVEVAARCRVYAG